MKATGLVFKSRDYIGTAEPPATVLEDESRFGNDGAFLGAGQPNWVQLPSGLWVTSFDATDDVITVPDNDSLDFGAGDFTLSIWYKATNISIIRNLIYKVDPGAPLSGYVLRMLATNVIIFYITGSGAGGKIKNSNTIITDGAWHHLAATRRSETNLALFLDGAGDGSRADADVGDLCTSATDLLIGAGGGQVTDGTISGVKIYNRALAPEEIAAHYQATRHWFGV